MENSQTENDIGVKGAELLSYALKNNSTLTELFLFGDAKIKKAVHVEEKNEINLDRM